VKKKDLVSVYKVETWQGAGPYDAKYITLERMHDAHAGTRPMPSDDGIPRLLSSEVCGFGSREDLDEWFKGFKRALYAEGFNIARYAVPSHLIRYGRTQLVFERKSLVPTTRLPIIRGGKVHR
jgi:hypothetical protein